MALGGVKGGGLSKREQSVARGRALLEMGSMRDALWAASRGIKGNLPWWKEGQTRAERVIAFCQDMTVTSGGLAGQKLRLRDWQREFIDRIYAEDEGSVRVIRTAVLTMGRKCGKTQLAAALALCHLVGPEVEPRGEVYSCANDRFQAAKIFNEMVAMIQAHPVLNDRCNIMRHAKQIEDLESGSIYAALSSEAKTKMGLNPSFCVYDELGQTGSRELYDAMDTAMGARKEPMLLVISTQAADDNWPMSQLIDYGLKVNAGEIIDPRFYLKMYAADPDADPWAEESWHAANPALGDFRSLEDVRRLAAQAQRMRSQENAFRNLVLNQRVSAESHFIERSVWATCDAPPQIPPGAKVYGGLDLGATSDMSALALVYRDADAHWHAQMHFWLPGNIRERVEQDHAPYDVWIRDGLVTPAGVTTSPKAIALRVAELSGQYKIQAIGFDRWRIADFRRELHEIGCPVPLIEHGQGYKDMTPAIDVVERLILRQELRHGGNPVLRTCVANAVVVRDPAGGRKLDKAKSTGRIDGIVALAMALSVGLLKANEAVDIESMIG
jgi:phage terminase large subunit-like protein